ncbi:hypothetical protein HPB51_023572 [Rhipicephalus microplus]|uniref:Uncharacterized protein n=1 Tax=Rhipicephalus microplus TaxID=6941 RepID=A0A9J6DD60_RHIMP|nr:hypothetical protein HPB51_023572 [Rhipicephalus microplus]
MPSTSKAEEIIMNSQEMALDELVLKKRAFEAKCKQKENEHNDNLEAKFKKIVTKNEALLVANIAAVTAMKQTVDAYQAENTSRIAYMEKTLQPIVSHPMSAPLFTLQSLNQETLYTPTQSWPPAHQQQA